MKELISIIVPVYNVDKYISYCIESIRRQSIQNFELILVNDGSKDNSGTICDEYAQIDSRIKVIHKKNGGLGSARNAGIDMATGEFIFFCDSDDWIGINYLEILYSAIIEYKADQAVGSFTKVTENEKICIKHEEGIYDLSTSEDKIQYCFYKIFGRKHGWETWTRLYRTNIIKNNEIRFCEHCDNFAEDLGYSLVYSLYCSKIVSVNSAEYFYRVRPNSIMTSNVGQFKFNAVNEIFIYFHDKYIKALDGYRIKDILPIFHFLIMFNQYFNIIGTTSYPMLKKELNNIENYDVWSQQTKQLLNIKHYKLLKQYFGKYNAIRILLLSHYCLHGNWNRFKIESGLFYRFNNKGGN